ncbi:hypothetical protein HYT45_04765 [Candidatus Uhrbacteria bacterium]|nr:hypothetical protein [Candidatus Uhrbacteria bacterium]
MNLEEKVAAIDSVSSIPNSIFQILDSMKDFGLTIADGVAHFTKLVVQELFVEKLVVENIVAKTVRAQELCTEDICVNRAQLKTLLENAGMMPSAVVENTINDTNIRMGTNDTNEYESASSSVESPESSFQGATSTEETVEGTPLEPTGASALPLTGQAASETPAEDPIVTEDTGVESTTDTINEESTAPSTEING